MEKTRNDLKSNRVKNPVILEEITTQDAIKELRQIAKDIYLINQKKSIEEEERSKEENLWKRRAVLRAIINPHNQNT